MKVLQWLAVALFAVLMVGGTVAAIAAGADSTGTVSVCATATLPDRMHTIGVDGVDVNTITDSGTSSQACSTQTYDIPTSTETDTTTATTTVTSTVTSTTTQTIQPVGNPQGKAWTLAFADEFNGTTIDATKWYTYPLNGNGDNSVESNPADCTISGGHLALQVNANPAGSSTAYDGCEIASAYQPYTGHPTGANAWELGVGDYLEFHAYFPDTNPITVAGGPIANWTAVWARGTGASTFEEYDVAEGTVPLTCNYHSPTQNLNVCSPGHPNLTAEAAWGSSWHTFGVYRGATTMWFYWDGSLVGSAPESVSAANAVPAAIRFTSGVHTNEPNAIITGPAGATLVDWVRGYTGG